MVERRRESVAAGEWWHEMLAARTGPRRGARAGTQPLPGTGRRSGERGASDPGEEPPAGARTVGCGERPVPSAAAALALPYGWERGVAVVDLICFYRAAGGSGWQ